MHGPMYVIYNIVLPNLGLRFAFEVISRRPLWVPKILYNNTSAFVYKTVVHKDWFSLYNSFTYLSMQSRFLALVRA